MKKKLIINGEKIFVLAETLSKVLNEINIIKKKNIAVAVNEEVIEKTKVVPPKTGLGEEKSDEIISSHY